MPLLERCSRGICNRVCAAHAVSHGRFSRWASEGLGRPMSSPLILYSCNTWLAWAVAERFYRGMHYCWCSPYYQAPTSPMHTRIPPSASPAQLIEEYRAAAQSGDRHCDAIKRNKRGVLKGAKAKLATNVISEDAHAEIQDIVGQSTPADYYPLLYVIPFAKVRPRVASVAPKHRAHPMSQEMLIEFLPRRCFDVVSFKDGQQ